MSHPLQIKTFPLKGSRLIEASAGTGKTYTIALLYVRLVLNHGGDHAFGRQLVPPEILVVTFTEAASQELSDRIRSRLAEAARAFADADFRKTVDEELQDLIADYADDQYAACAMTLQRAAEWMDEAAVSTIHSWCYRMLREHAFDSRNLFTQELVTNQDELLLEVVEDYWRQQFYPMDEFVAAALKEYLASPSGLLSAIRPILSVSQAAPVYDGLLLDIQNRPANGFSQWVSARKCALEAIKTTWQADQQAIEQLLRERWSDLDGRKHGKLDELLSAMADWLSNASTDIPKKLLALQAGKFDIKKSAKDQSQPQHAVFDDIEKLAEFSEDDLCRELAILKWQAAKAIQLELERRLASRAELGFNDMLVRLQQALHSESGERLAAAIRQQFPVAMIDEFQDTDPVQYGIFNAIYNVASNDPSTAFVIIGDPKQAIYAFRGADIYTYLKARMATEGRHYTLGKNFRSTKAVVDAVNALFSHAETHARGAFRFKEEDGNNPVPFEPVESNGRKEQFQIDGTVQPPVTAWLLPGANDSGVTGPGQYRAAMARVAASEIVRWLELAKAGQAGFAEPGKPFKPLQPKDIAILVRTGTEANAIRHALADRGVASVYLSDRDSVFASAEAPDVLRWLRAVAEPDNSRLLKPALASAGIGLPLPQLASLFESESDWENAVLRFRSYRSVWQMHGVLPMLRQLLADFAVASRLLQQGDGERALTNLLHIAEWLQQQSHTVDGEQALIRLLADKIANPSEEDVLRLESDADLVKVVTIHKSKGLEYPLVLLPFACVRKKKNGDVVTYHQRDEATGEYTVLTELSGAFSGQADDERLSEDMRLLYVALTRARHALWLGITPLADAKNSKTTNLHESAFGYLVQGGSPITPDAVSQCLPADVVSRETLPVFPDLMNQQLQHYTPAQDETVLAPAREMGRKAAAEPWWVASYSALKTGELQALSGDAQRLPEPEDPRQSTADEEAEAEGTHGSQFVVAAGDVLTMHHFPRGPNPGTFLHGLLEWAAGEGFSVALQDDIARRDHIAQCCNRRNWEKWIDPLDSWMKTLLDVPLPVGGNSFRLADVQHCLPEMEFWFESRSVNSLVLDRLVHQHTLAGAERPQLLENMLNGMLKGFIDLVFEHGGQYYVADWKSNWLGDDVEAYSLGAMRDAILHKRYELQYTLYILALHRHLQDRMPGYDYDRHIGGAVYVFLRGIHHCSTRGVHFEKPPRALVEQLDVLFAGAGRECAA